MATAPPPPPDWANRQQIALAEIGPPAGFWIRFVAYLIDALILGVVACIMVGIVVGLVLLSGMSVDDDEIPAAVFVAIALGVVIMIVIGWLYEALLTSGPRGATLGKQVSACASWDLTAAGFRSAAPPAAIS